MSIILEFMHMQEHLSVTCIDTYIVIITRIHFTCDWLFISTMYGMCTVGSYTYVLLIFTKQNNKG